jgi:hypothetical protein
MPALSEADREAIFNEMIAKNRAGEIDSLTRAELRAAIDATDDWTVANAASYNSALPQPARGVLTAPQKALLLSYVIRRRWLVGA